MGRRAGAVPAAVVSGVVVVVGVFLVRGDGSSVAFGWALVVVGVLFGAVNLLLAARGR